MSNHRKHNKQISGILGSRGITLTELLIASAMIGIVMIGVASFSLSTQQLHSSSSHASIVAMRTKTVMARIAEDVSRAVGDITDPGIVPFVGINVFSICFRHDTNITPETYADDQWICYLHDATAGTETSLELCSVPPGNVPVQNVADCDGAGAREKILELDDAAPQFFDIVEDADNRLLYVEITLQTLYDHSQNYHAVTNPRYTLTTQIQPEAHSR